MTSVVSATTMPRRPNNTACRVAAIILDLASGRDHTSDALPAASVKTGMATVARVTIRTSACIGGGPIRQPCDQALNDTTNVVLVVGGRNGAFDLLELDGNDLR